MHPEAIANYMGISEANVEELLALSPDAVYTDAVYQSVIRRLDKALLLRTLVHVRTAYEGGLDQIKEKYGLGDTIMSGFTLGNWVLGFLANPNRLAVMLDRHARIPTDVIRHALPELVELLDDLPEGRAEWQRALVTFSLPLIVRG